MKIVNKTGYLKGAKTAKNPVNIIPSSLITTQGMAFPIKANGKTLYPNTGQYKFPTSHVIETPLKKKFQEGTEELDAMSYAKFPNRIKDKKRRDTQVADIYNSTLDDFKGDTINAKRRFKSYFTHYGSERFDNVKSLEGYYGFDKKDYEDKTLDSLGKNWHKQMKVSKKIDGTKGAKTKVKIKKEPEFGAGLFGNLFGKAGNPVVDKKENAKRRQEFEASTKRGLSSEGLGDLFMGLSGEAITGAITKAGSKLYKAASPYVKNALKGLNANKKGLVQTNKIKDPDIVKNQEALANEAKRLLIPKQRLVDKDFFYTNSQVKKRVQNNKNFEQLEKEINEIDPNIITDEDLDKALIANPDLQKRWYDMMDEGKSFKDNMLTPSQEKYVRKNLESNAHQLDFRNMLSRKNLEGFQKGLTKQPLTSKQVERYTQEGIDPANPFYGYTGGYTKEGVYPSPEQLKKIKFPIRFGVGSMNKNGNKNVKSNLVKYKEGSKGVSLAFSRGEKDPKGGLTQKGVDKYNRATGGNLKMAVTTPPSKLKAGSKPANRRKSFCARMSGVKGPMAKNGKPTRKALALRKWNC